MSETDFGERLSAESEDFTVLLIVSLWQRKGGTLYGKSGGYGVISWIFYKHTTKTLYYSNVKIGIAHFSSRHKGTPGFTGEWSVCERRFYWRLALTKYHLRMPGA